MPLYIATADSANASLMFSLERLSDGYWWSFASSAWEADPELGDREQALTEGTGPLLGSFTGAVTGLGDAGWVRVRVHSAEYPMTGTGTYAESTATVRGVDVYVWGDEEVGGEYLVDIKARTDTIGSGRVTTVSPVAQGGRVTIVRGDSYTTALGRALRWTDVDAAWPVLSEATVTFNVDDGSLEVTGTVVTASGAGKEVKAEPTSTQTETLPRGVYDYAVVATYDGVGTGTDGAVTLVRGKCEVVDREDS